MSKPTKQKSILEGLNKEEKDFFLACLEKKNRNLTKKIKEIEALEQLRD